MVEGLLFDPPRFAVNDHDRIELTLENHDPHGKSANFVLIKPGALRAIQEASLQIDEAPVIMQLPELTRVADTEGDGLADFYQTICDDFSMTGQMPIGEMNVARSRELPGGSAKRARIFAGSR